MNIKSWNTKTNTYHFVFSREELEEITSELAKHEIFPGMLGVILEVLRVSNRVQKGTNTSKSV